MLFRLAIVALLLHVAICPIAPVAPGLASTGTEDAVALVVDAGGDGAGAIRERGR
ncbi:hypothetical protein [Pseudonocardia nigra]|uniref:hypothetical protein n=1 Tax=Pseudonocardia nigra TaxID=1921578 RepID=UPI001C5DBD26|nr:hypothetical protein [Pseudonocardia nigra]